MVSSRIMQRILYTAQVYRIVFLFQSDLLLIQPTASSSIRRIFISESAVFFFGNFTRPTKSFVQALRFYFMTAVRSRCSHGWSTDDQSESET